MPYAVYRITAFVLLLSAVQAGVQTETGCLFLVAFVAVLFYSEGVKPYEEKL